MQLADPTPPATDESQDLSAQHNCEERFRRACEEAVAGMSLATLDARCKRQDGQSVWISISADPARGDGKYCVTTSRATIEHQRAEQMENDRRDILELIARDTPLTEVMNRIAQLVERQTDDCLAMMTVLIDGNVLLHAPSLAATLVQKLQVGLLPLASSLNGDAWQSGTCVGTSDIDTDPRWQNVRQAAQSLGVARCWTRPIISDDISSHGAISLLCRHKRAPSAAETEILTMVSRLAALSIERNATTIQLAHLVRHDRLTGLPNRLLLEGRIDDAISQSRRTGRYVALMVLDIDKFKETNDTLGHHAGDQLLQLFSQRLRGRLRETDVLARTGGDEFVVLLPEIAEAAHAAVVAQKLVDALVEPFAIAEERVRATASIGIALYPRDADKAARLQQIADAALYRMKARGRNGFSF